MKSEEKRKKFNEAKKNYQYLMYKRELEKGRFVVATNEEINNYKFCVDFDFFCVDNKISFEDLENITKCLLKQVVVKKKSNILSI